MRTPRRILMLGLGVASFAAVMSPSAASASRFHPEVGSPYQPAGFSFGEPQRMAIDQATGNIYVKEGPGGGQVVRIFASGGAAPVGGVPAEISAAETPHQTGFPSGVAVDSACYYQKLSGGACTTFDPSDGDVYLDAPGENAVDKYQLHEGKWEYVCQFVGWGFTGTACHKNSAGREAEPTEGEFSEPEGVAVDTQGNVYVANYGDADLTVYEFDSSGAQVAKIASTFEARAGNVAVSAAGDVYISPWGGGQIIEMKKTGPGKYEEQPLTSATGAALAVDANGDVYTPASPFITEYNSKLESQSTIGETFLEYASEALAVDDATNNLVMLGATIGSYSVAVHTWGPEANFPDFAFEAPTANPRSLVVHGTVNPNETVITSCEIELAAQFFLEEYEEAHQCTVGTGNTPLPVSSEFTGLTPNSSYVERIRAGNAAGKVKSQDVVVQTSSEPAEVKEVGTDAITRTTALLQAVVNPEHSPTSYHVLWGKTQSYTAATPVIEAGEDLIDHLVVVKLEGLTPGTTYHYEVVTENPGGSTTSSDHEFTTSPLKAPSVANVGVSGLEPGAAVVSGTVIANGLPSKWEIDFGADTNYVTKLTGEVIGEEQTISLSLFYLVPDTVYHYRIVVRNVDGVAETPDATFKTPLYPLKIPQILPQVSALIAGFPTEHGTIPSGKAGKAKAKGKGKGKGKGAHHKGHKKHKLHRGTRGKG